MERRWPEFADLLIREGLRARRERDQKVDGVPQAAAVRRPVAPEVEAQSVAERREAQKRGQVEDAVIPRQGACELARLPPVRLEFLADIDLGILEIRSRDVRLSGIQGKGDDLHVIPRLLIVAS